MSNRCFLSSFTLRLYLLIFWTSVEQCRGLEKCCPVDKDCCVCNPTLSARVFSGTNCCTLAPHCHPDLHHCNNTTPRPRRWSTLISWTASPLLCRCRWPAHQMEMMAWLRKAKWHWQWRFCALFCSFSRLYFLLFLTHSCPFIPGFRILQEMLKI